MKLSKIERIKLELAPFDYFAKLEELDFSNLSEDDRFYLKNFGIYTQSQRADEFMIRVRVAGGRVGLNDLENILQVAKKFGANIILTARAQIELQKLTPSTILNAYQMLESFNLTSWQTLTDNVRNIVTDVFDGVGKSSKIEVQNIVQKMQELVLYKKEYVGMLPRKFNVAMSGSSANLTSFFGNDCYFALALKDGVYGFNLYLGGKNSLVAKSADIFVSKEEVVRVFEAVVKTYIKYGNRASRTKARLSFLLEEISIDGFKERMQEFYKQEFKGAGKTLIEKLENRDDFFELRNGEFAYRFKSKFAEVDLATLEKLLKYARDNSLSLRLGVDQNIYLLGLKSKQVPFKALSENQNILVCAGSKYCFFSLFDTKEEAAKIDLAEINRYNIKVGYSGCLKGCGRHYFSDIGLVGIRTNLYGTKEFGVRVYLGGLYTQGESVARLIYWAVPLRILNSLIKTIIDEFKQSRCKSFEEFSKDVLLNFEPEFLAFWFLAKLYTKKELSLKEPNSFDYLLYGENVIVKELKDSKNRLYETIKQLEKKVFIKS